MSLIERVQPILVRPKQTWPVIAAEGGDAASIFTGYVMILAAIPAVAGFIGFSIVPLGGFLSKYGIPIPAGIAHMVLDYLFGLGSVYVLALIIDAFAPTFEGEKNLLQAMKLAVFSSTAAWLAGIFFILPALSILYLLALYSLYLLYLGLPLLMNVREDKHAPYFVVICVMTLVINVVARALTALTIPGPLRGF